MKCVYIERLERDLAYAQDSGIRGEPIVKLQTRIEEVRMNLHKRLYGTCPGGLRCPNCSNPAGPRDLAVVRRVVRRRLNRLAEVEISAGFAELEDDAIERRDRAEREYLLACGV